LSLILLEKGRTAAKSDISLKKTGCGNPLQILRFCIYYEGYAPDKYEEVPKHGDSYIICQKS